MNLYFQGVTKEYADLKAVNHLSFSAEGGDIFAIIGANGAGKTTLIRLAAGLEKPSNGEILFDDIPLREINQGKIGILTTDSYLYSDLTVQENLEFYTDLYRSRKDLWEGYAESFELASILNKVVKELSHGQIRRLSLVRVMLGEPKVLLLDEPFLGLDSEASVELGKMILTFSEKGGVILLATHQFDQASSIVNKVMVLDKGELIYANRFNESTESLSHFYNNLRGNLS